MTRRRRRHFGTVPLLLVALLMVTVACGSDDGDEAGGGGSGEAGELSGSVVVDGSSTVEPITSGMAEEFRKEQPGVQVSVGTSGTGGGFKKFCAGETDISNASRAIEDEEKAACQAAGITYKEFRIGLDGLAVVTSADNEFLECLDYEQLAAIWKQGGATTWNQVDPEFPAERIAIFAPDSESGTFDFFNEEVLGDPDAASTPKPRSDYTASPDDNVLVQGVKGEKNSFGYFGFAYYQENKDELRDVKVSETRGGQCVEPTAASVESGDYPLSRPLYIYAKDSSLSRPEVRGFVQFYLEYAPELVADVGYVAASDDDYRNGLDELEKLTQK